MLAENVEGHDYRLSDQTGGAAGDQRLDLVVDTTDRRVAREQVTDALVRRHVKHPGDYLNGADPEASVKARDTLRFVNLSPRVYHAC